MEEYINNKKQIDSQFINKSIDLFAKQFPNAITDYGILLNRVHIHYDADENQAERKSDDLMNTVGKYFKLSAINTSSPIIGESIKTDDQTQLVIIDKNHSFNWKKLKKIFPQIPKSAKIKSDSKYIFAFYDNTQRPIIILTGKDSNDIALLLKKMKEQHNFKANDPIQFKE